jgi:hypothetical protein
MDQLGKQPNGLLNDVWLNLLQTDFGCVILVVGSVLYGLWILTRFEISHSVGRTAAMPKFELMLLCVYSPAHALMWMVITSTNCILVVITMAILSKQVGFVGLLNPVHWCIMYFSYLCCVMHIMQSSATVKLGLRRSEFCSCSSLSDTRCS